MDNALRIVLHRIRHDRTHISHYFCRIFLYSFQDMILDSDFHANLAHMNDSLLDYHNQLGRNDLYIGIGVHTNHFYSLCMFRCFCDTLLVRSFEDKSDHTYPHDTQFDKNCTIVWFYCIQTHHILNYLTHIHNYRRTIRTRSHLCIYLLRKNIALHLPENIRYV